MLSPCSKPSGGALIYPKYQVLSFHLNSIEGSLKHKGAFLGGNPRAAPPYVTSIALYYWQTQKATKLPVNMQSSAPRISHGLIGGPPGIPLLQARKTRQFLNFSHSLAAAARTVHQNPSNIYRGKR
jgi:hypothetical protein